jgi:ribonuclease P protein component
MTGRITRAVDFERVLKTNSQARSPHFAVHHLASVPSAPEKPVSKPASAQLSTSSVERTLVPVDDTAVGQPGKALNQGVWLGMVVPKRHAKRAVTRTLLKRQIKAVMELQTPAPPGLWVVRLRAPFDRTVYVSAASKALSTVAREELTRVLNSAAQRLLAA